MTRVVLDTNVLVSGFPESRHPERAPAQLVLRWREGGYLLLASDQIRIKFARALRKPYYQARFTQEQVQAAEHLLKAQAQSVAVEVQVAAVATHPEDDAILATAISGQADFLVTGDRQLQRLGTYQGIAIVSPREFLTLLDRLEQDDEILP
jgi:putative PIN family toxin of toxin-antitoxin system